MQINTGRGYEWGPLWLDINQECVNVSHAIQKHKHPHFLGLSLPPVLIRPATFYTVKQSAVYFFPPKYQTLFRLISSWSRWEPKSTLLRSHPTVFCHKQSRLTTHLFGLGRQETTLCVLTKGHTISQWCCCAGFYVIAESLAEYLVLTRNRPIFERYDTLSITFVLSQQEYDNFNAVK